MWGGGGGGVEEIRNKRRVGGGNKREDGREGGKKGGKRGGRSSQTLHTIAQGNQQLLFCVTKLLWNKLSGTTQYQLLQASTYVHKYIRLMLSELVDCLLLHISHGDILHILHIPLHPLSARCWQR